MIVVDFGTSTNFDVVSPEGEYVGGVLAPGIEISMEALFARAARLVNVDFVGARERDRQDDGGAVSSSGLVYGFAGQVDGIVAASAPSSSRRRRPRSRPAAWRSSSLRTAWRSSASIRSSPSTGSGSSGS